MNACWQWSTTASSTAASLFNFTPRAAVDCKSSFSRLRPEALEPEELEESDGDCSLPKVLGVGIGASRRLIFAALTVSSRRVAVVWPNVSCFFNLNSWGMAHRARFGDG